MAGSEMPDSIKARFGGLNRLCERYCVRDLSVFGSAVKGRLTEASDLDLLVTFNESLAAGDMSASYFGLKEELEVLFSRPIHLMSAVSLTNPYFRESVMEERQPLYAV